MIVLVANLGSTSFKAKLFEMDRDESGDPIERVLAQAAADRIGLDGGVWSVVSGEKFDKGDAKLADHGAAIELLLKKVVKLGALESIAQVEAIGFNAVHGGPISGAVVVDDEVLETMQRFADVAPQHNPPYIAAMKALAKRLPDVPQIAAFETAFHQTIPDKRRVYAIPHEWTEDLGIRRYGFHGASHRYISERILQLVEEPKKLKRVISCHLGGSSSVCAIQGGQSVANSFGMTVQTGLPHASRVGDFDAFAILKLLGAGIGLDEIWKRLGSEGGLLGISGISSDLRDIYAAADEGHGRAQLALDVLVESVRNYVGAYLTVLGGADALVFTGGIGQHSWMMRAQVLSRLEYAGIKVNWAKNEGADGNEETPLHTPDSATQVWVIPTNEELVVARQTVHALTGK